MPFPLRLLSPFPVLSVPSDSPSLSLSSLFSLARSLFRGANPLAPPSHPSRSYPSDPTSSTARFAFSSSLLALCAYITCTFLSFPLAVVFSPFYSHRSCDRTPLSLAVSFHYSSRLDCMDGIYIYIHTLFVHTNTYRACRIAPLTQRQRVPFPRVITSWGYDCQLPPFSRARPSRRAAPPSSSAISVPTALSRAVERDGGESGFCLPLSLLRCLFSVSRTALSFL